MKYITYRGKFKKLKIILNLCTFLCLLMILGLSKPVEVQKSVKFIASPIFKIFEQFKSSGREYTNIFNL
jgi:hypothetical protein